MATMGRTLELAHQGVAVTFDQDEVWLGRDPAADFSLDSDTVSHAHAQIKRCGSDWLIRPEEAVNGTMRRGAWLLPLRWSLLASGDVLLLGDAEVRVRMPEIPEQGARLVGLVGLVALQVYQLENKPGGVRIGRADGADIRVPTVNTSRHHARLTLVDGGWWIADDGSTSGVFVNERKSTDHRLAHGDEVRLGDAVFAFVHPERSGLAFGETDEQKAGGPDTAPQPELGDRATLILQRK
jgi:pSer/pThr/pTyr-binding forkhead associated (FHA) protein